MKTFKDLGKRGLSLLIAFMLCVSMMPVSAFASDADETAETTVEAPVESVPETKPPSDGPSGEDETPAPAAEEAEETKPDTDKETEADKTEETEADETEESEDIKSDDPKESEDENPDEIKETEDENPDEPKETEDENLDEPKESEDDKSDDSKGSEDDTSDKTEETKDGKSDDAGDSKSSESEETGTDLAEGETADEGEPSADNAESEPLAEGAPPVEENLSAEEQTSEVNAVYPTDKLFFDTSGSDSEVNDDDDDKDDEKDTLDSPKTLMLPKAPVKKAAAQSKLSDTLGLSGKEETSDSNVDQDEGTSDTNSNNPSGSNDPAEGSGVKQPEGAGNSSTQLMIDDVQLSDEAEGAPAPLDDDLMVTSENPVEGEPNEGGIGAAMAKAAKKAAATVINTWNELVSFLTGGNDNGQDGELSETFDDSREYTSDTAISVTGTKTLDLNGKTIQINGKSGAISVDGGTLTVKDFTGQGMIKQTAATGSVINVTSGQFNLENGIITGGKDSGIVVDGGAELNMTGGAVINNTSKTDGGGVRVANGTFNMSGGIIESNHAAQGWKLDDKGNPSGETVGRGGGVYVSADSSFYLSGNDSLITENDAGEGGGIFVDINNGNKKGYFEMVGGTVDSNVAKLGEGGGIYLKGDGSISKGSITNNRTEGTKDLGGGGIYIESGGSLELKNALITENGAAGVGGGIAACVHGKTTINAQEGAAIFDNKTKVDKDLTITLDQYAHTEGYSSGWGSFTDGYNNTNANSNKPYDKTDFLGWEKNEAFKTGATDVFAAGSLIQINGQGYAGVSIGDGMLGGGLANWNGMSYNYEGMDVKKDTNGRIVYKLVDANGNSVLNAAGESQYYVEIGGNRVLTNAEGTPQTGSLHNAANAHGMVQPVATGSITTTTINGQNNTYIYASRLLGLTAKPDDDAKDLAKNNALVVISGNWSATHGGGIGNNGELIIGLAPHKDESDSGNRVEKDVNEVRLDISKVLNGQNAATGDREQQQLKGGEYIFELLDKDGNAVKDKNGNPITVTNRADGQIDLNFSRDIMFENGVPVAGHQTFLLRESSAGQNAYTDFDNRVFKIDFDVTLKSSEIHEEVGGSFTETPGTVTTEIYHASTPTISVGKPTGGKEIPDGYEPVVSTGNKGEITFVNEYHPEYKYTLEKVTSEEKLTFIGDNGNQLVQDGNEMWKIVDRAGNDVILSDNKPATVWMYTDSEGNKVTATIKDGKLFWMSEGEVTLNVKNNAAPGTNNQVVIRTETDGSAVLRVKDDRVQFQISYMNADGTRMYCTKGEDGKYAFTEKEATVTLADGIIDLDGLLLKDITYYVKETEAPDGYVLDPETYVILSEKDYKEYLKALAADVKDITGQKWMENIMILGYANDTRVNGQIQTVKNSFLNMAQKPTEEEEKPEEKYFGFDLTKVSSSEDKGIGDGKETKFELYYINKIIDPETGKEISVKMYLSKDQEGNYVFTHVPTTIATSGHKLKIDNKLLKDIVYYLHEMEAPEGFVQDPNIYVINENGVLEKVPVEDGGASVDDLQSKRDDVQSKLELLGEAEGAMNKLQEDTQKQADDIQTLVKELEKFVASEEELNKIKHDFNTKRQELLDEIDAFNGKKSNLDELKKVHGVDEKEQRFVELRDSLTRQQARFDSYKALYNAATSEEQKSAYRARMQSIKIAAAAELSEFNVLRTELETLRSAPYGEDGRSISEIETELSNLPESLTTKLDAYNDVSMKLNDILDAAVSVKLNTVEDADIATVRDLLEALKGLKDSISSYAGVDGNDGEYKKHLGQINNSVTDYNKALKELNQLIDQYKWLGLVEGEQFIHNFPNDPEYVSENYPVITWSQIGVDSVEDAISESATAYSTMGMDGSFGFDVPGAPNITNTPDDPDDSPDDTDTPTTTDEPVIPDEPTPLSEAAPVEEAAETEEVTDINDDDVPLADAPEEELVELPEDPVPLAAMPPLTGDSSMLWLYLALLMAGSALFCLRRKEEA